MVMPSGNLWGKGLISVAGIFRVGLARRIPLIPSLSQQIPRCNVERCSEQKQRSDARLLFPFLDALQKAVAETGFP